MTINFKYKTIRRPDGSEVRTPSIPVILKGQEKINTLALVDSGADISAISLGMAEILGLDLSGKKGFAYGIGGRVNSIETTMNLSVEKGHEHYTFQIPLKVILGNYDFSTILGRAGFFDKFVISFDQSQEKVSLKKVSKR
jgi:hypothetical protein